MNWETLDKTIVYARNTEKICKVLVINLRRPLYVTDMCYLEECSGSECHSIYS